MSSISNNLSNIIKEEVRLVNNLRQVNHLGTEKKKKKENPPTQSLKIVMLKIYQTHERHVIEY